MPNEMMNKENVVDIHKVLYLVLKNEVVAFSGMDGTRHYVK